MSHLIPNRNDIANLRRWLDDLQLRGSDHTTVEKWRALLDTFEIVDQVCEVTAELTGDLESTVNRVEGIPENADITIDIAGTLDDLQEDDTENGITQATRKVIDEAIAKANREASARLEKAIASEVEDARRAIEGLDDPRLTLEKRRAEERARHEKRESKRGRK